MDYEDKRLLFPELAQIIKPKVSLGDISQDFINSAIRHGFSGLLYERLRQSHQVQTVGQQDLRKKALISEATALVRLEALAELIVNAQMRGLLMLLMKGMHFAYQLYSSPGQRVSSDIDIFIDQSQVPEFGSLLSELGYEANIPLEESMISFQFTAMKVSNTGHTIVLDVHYKINNQAEYEGLFEFSKIFKRAVRVPEICEHAKALCFADAYTYACVHLHGHHLLGDPIKAIWLYDIHLILEAMTEEDQTGAIEILGSGSIGGVCKYWTNIVVDNFSTRLPPKLKQSLSELPQLAIKDSVSVNPVKLLWDQLVFLPDSRARLTFLRQLFIPSEQRVREKYSDSNAWLPILYFRRALSGFWSRLLKIRK